MTAASVGQTLPASVTDRAWYQRKDLLFQVWQLALPVIFTNLLQSLVDVIDVFMVGRLGPIAIAAAGMSTAIRFLVLVMLLSVAAGAMTLIAQAKGARDPQQMSFVTRQSISSGFLISLVLTAGGYLLARPLLMLANSGGDPQAVELGTAYLQILFLGTPFMVLNMVFNRLMQGAGDTLTPLWMTGSINLLNVLFNYVFMFGAGPIPAFGIAGAAMGTVTARAIGVVVAFLIVYSGKNVVKLLPGSYWPDWQMFKDIFTIGVPSGIQGVFRNGSRLLVLGILTSTEVGTYGAAAMAIGFQVEALVFMPGLALNVAATTLVGQALGQWQPQEARVRGNMAIGLGLLIMVVLAAPVIALAPWIIELFDPSAHPVVMKTGVTYLHINTVFLPLSAVAMVANGAMRGAGDSFPGMVSTAFTRGVISVSLAWLLAFPLGMGSLGVWIALVIGSVLDAIYMGWRWRGSAWLTVALHKTTLYRTHLRHLSTQLQQQYLREVRTPLMAVPSTREVVDAAGVVYTLPEHQVAVRFDDQSYHLVERKI
ncbi:MAG: MATE family efflux transporter [Caldilineaceae bacterium]|nr:MATE family efflux transporter [Caldilineaceae bacterium]